MPATSLSGESRARRSRADALARPRSRELPALEGAHDLPEVEVAVHALDRDRYVEGGQRRRRPRATGRRTARARAPRRRPGRAGPSCPRPAPRAPCFRAYPVGSGAGERACTSAVAAPRRSASPAKSPPTSSACRSASAYRSRTLVRASSQPSMARLEVALRDRQAGSHLLAVVAGPRALEPAQRARDVRAARSGQRGMHLDVRVEPGGDLAEHLEDRRVAEDRPRCCSAPRRRRARARRRASRPPTGCGGTPSRRTGADP